MPTPLLTGKTAIPRNQALKVSIIQVINKILIMRIHIKRMEATRHNLTTAHSQPIEVGIINKCRTEDTLVQGLRLMLVTLQEAEAIFKTCSGLLVVAAVEGEFQSPRPRHHYNSTLMISNLPHLKMIIHFALRKICKWRIKAARRKTCLPRGNKILVKRAQSSALPSK